MNIKNKTKIKDKYKAKQPVRLAGWLWLALAGCLTSRNENKTIT